MNDVTLEYYEENSQTFVESTLSVNMSGFYSEFLSHVQPGGHILDLGCGSGPTIVGAVAEKFGDDLKIGVLSAVVFPVVLVIVNVLLKQEKREQHS